MTRQETIKLLNSFKAYKPKYWMNFSSSEKQGLVDDWTNEFLDVPVDEVAKLVDRYIKNQNRIPYPRQIRGLMTETDKTSKVSFSNRWYSHFPKKGEITYNDKDVEWATWDDWNHIPEELARRMKFEPDPSDPERLELLKEIKLLQLEAFGESSVDDAIKEAEAKQNVRNNH